MEKSWKLEFRRGSGVWTVLLFDADGTKVWQNVYFTPHPVFG